MGVRALVTAGCVALPTAIGLMAGTPALAEQWPTRPVTIICPFSPGISADLLTRAVAAALSDTFGQQFIVENRPGANGNIGTAAAAKSAPDGYTLLMATVGPTVANKFMYKSMSYDPEKAFTPIVMIGASAMTIVSSPKIPPSSFKDLIAYAKKHPGALNAGTVGRGSQAHITLELINKLAGTSIMHVPYRVATQALPDLISGDLQVGFNYIPTLVPAIQQGLVRGLAVTSLKRVSDLPEVPTVDESMFPGFEAAGWNALFAPAGIAPEIVSKLNAAADKFLASAEGRAQLGRMGMTPGGGSPEDLEHHLARERAKWGPVITEAGITLD